MEIQRLTSNDKELVKQCDKLLIKLFKEESVYDDKLNTLICDLESKNNILLVAKENNNVLGFLFGFVKKNKMSKKAVANLSYIYVESNYRNNKIATKL